jgi:hypothetical protein
MPEVHRHASLASPVDARTRFPKARSIVAYFLMLN